jgi:hypothetical protein
MAEVRGDSTGSGTRGSNEAPVSASRTAEPTEIAPASVQSCITAVQRGANAVAVARATVADWAAHVQAMSDLESGRNSEAETKQIWAETRSRGPAGVAGFHTADAAYKEAVGACRKTSDIEAGAEVAAALATCRDVTEQSDAVLGAARGAVADWAAHLKAMADRKAGRLDPHHASLKWLTAYKAAPVNIKKFQAAERIYRAHTPCEPPG